MACEKLSLKGFINEMKDVSEGAHPRKFCFVLGAGASRSSGIKTGQELVWIWDRELNERYEDAHAKWREEKGITDDNMAAHYSDYYGRRFKRSSTDGYNYMEKIMEAAKPSTGYVMLAYILSATSHNVVITTNFDHLVEDALNYYMHKKPMVIGHEALSHYVSEQPSRPTIIKIHQDLLFDPKSKTEELEVLSERWKEALKRIFENYHPVFIGYAGNDKNVMDFLLENAEKFKKDEWKFPYWMLYKNDKLEGKVKQFLDACDGYWIEHSGFDNVFVQLGGRFGYEMPSENDFLSDPKERYSKLAKAIIEFGAEDKKEQEHRGQKSDDQQETVREAEPDDKVDVNNAIKAIINKAPEMVQLYREAMELFDDAEYEESEQRCRELVRREPENAQYSYLLGRVLDRQRESEEAEKYLRKAVELDGQNRKYREELGNFLLMDSRYSDALAVYEVLCDLEPDNDLYHWGKGLSLRKLGEYDKAAEAFRMVVKLDPNFSTGYQFLADALREAGRLDEALDAYRKALDKGVIYEESCQKVIVDILRELGRNTEADEMEAKFKEDE